MSSATEYYSDPLNSKFRESTNVPEVYYDLNASYKLNGHPTDATTTMSQEGFAAMYESYKNQESIQEDPIPEEHIEESFQEPISNMINDPVPTLYAKKDGSTDVQNPYGYGYVKSLTETRIQDANDILNQNSMLFSIGAVAGVSLIVLGILVTSNNNST